MILISEQHNDHDHPSLKDNHLTRGRGEREDSGEAGEYCSLSFDLKIDISIIMTSLSNILLFSIFKRARYIICKSFRKRSKKDLIPSFLCLAKKTQIFVSRPGIFQLESYHRVNVKEN